MIWIALALGFATMIVCNVSSASRRELFGEYFQQGFLYVAVGHALVTSIVFGVVFYGALLVGQLLLTLIWQPA
jgi:hypothetical protein